MESNQSGMGAVTALLKIFCHKKTIILNTIITGVVVGALTLCVPRYYTCEIMLAPEVGSGMALGSFSSLASSLGINLAGGMTSDAIAPSVYPDLFASKEFQVELFNIPVTTSDGEVSTDLYTYMEKHQKAPWWSSVFRFVKETVKSIFPSKDENLEKAKKITAFQLSEKQFQIAEAIESKISCNVDQTTGIITISATDQDPLVCATLAEAVKEHLQDYITRYRTSKARNDMEYYGMLLQQAKKDYEKSMNAYAAYSDSHHHIIMQSYISERDRLENDMQIKFNIHTALVQQYEQSKAKLQENTPAFTTLQCASVPIKPAGPKRVIITLLAMFLAFCLTSYYILSGKEKLKKFISIKKSLSSAHTDNAEQTTAEEQPQEVK